MFVNRENELKKLTNLFALKKASIVVCKGRRRIGKSRLIEEFGKSAKHYIEIQGLAPHDGITKKDQLSEFSRQLSKNTNLPYLELSSWPQAFSLLNSTIGNQKTIVLLDEISWLAIGDKKFAGQLKISWDTELKKHEQLVLVLCGSVSSWIDQNILKNTGFRGRVSMSLAIEELNLNHCNLFWTKKKANVVDMEKLKILSVTGGIPKYLEEIDMKCSAEENIKRLCFQKEGYLFNEFNEIFEDSFKNRASTYQKIVEKLSEGSFTAKEISSHLEWKNGGSVSKYLSDLTDSGFIQKHIMYSPGKKTPLRMIKYRLKDNYLRFYLKYIQPNRGKIENDIYEPIELEHLPEWHIIMGFQFENLVLNNIKTVCKAIGINLSTIKSAAPFFQKKTKMKAACQIDLLIETKYALYVCEIKFRKQIKNEVISQAAKKIASLKPPKQFTIRPVLIYAGSISPNIIEEDFFTHIIDFGQLLC